MKKTIMFIMSVLILSSCTPIWQTKYKMNLSEVEVSGILVQDLQKQDNNYTFEDENIKANFIINTEFIDFSILNKTNTTIRILWDNAVFVDIDNNSSKIVHSGIRFIDSANTQIPTVIVKQTKINDSIIPADNIDSFSNIYPLISEKLTKEQIINSKIKVYLPIEINNTIKEYLFTFTITDVERKENNPWRRNKK